MNSAWKKIWPDCVPDRDLDGLRPTLVQPGIAISFLYNSAIMDDIVTIGQSMGSEVDADNIEKILEDHSIELTTEEFEYLQDERERKLDDKIEEYKENVSSPLLNEMISKWIDLQNYADTQIQ